MSWKKVLVNIGINAATALAKVQNDLIARTDSGRQIAKVAVSEAIVVAQAESRSIRDDMVEYVMEVPERTAPNKSLIYQNFGAGRKTEIETLNSEVVRRVERHEIAVPVNQTLANSIRLAEEGSKRIYKRNRMNGFRQAITGATRAQIGKGNSKKNS